jgi:hypothetical protein
MSPAFNYTLVEGFLNALEARVKQTRSYGTHLTNVCLVALLSCIKCICHQPWNYPA